MNSLQLLKKLRKEVIGQYILKFPVPMARGESIEEAKNNLREAIKLIFKDRREDILRGLSDDVIQERLKLF